MPRFERLYRVFPWLDSASEGEPGHPLFVPTPQGHGRVDNPDRYLTLYASEDPVGAIGEAFGNHSEWTPYLLQGPPDLRGSRRALAVYDATAVDFLDLDDADELRARGIRPSRVVTRDRATTQGWALEVFLEQTWSGVRWWCYYKPEWGSFGVWKHEQLKVEDVLDLEANVGLVRQASFELNRPWR